MLRLAVGTAVALALLSACSKPETPASTGAAVAGLGAVKAEDFKGTLPMKELMAHVIDYNAFGVWKRQGWIIDKDGIHELFPTTEEDWFAAESSALTLAEASNLLLLPGRPQADERAWIEYAHQLHDEAMKTHDLAVARDKEAFFNAGGDIYVVCRDCHQRYIIGAEAPPMSKPPGGPTPQQAQPAPANPQPAPATPPAPN